MTLDEFVDFLDANGIAHKTTYQSIVLSDCPHCGSSKDKIYLFKERKNDAGAFYGRCMKCEGKINSYTFLMHLGFAKEVVDAMHGYHADGMATLRMMPALDILGRDEPVIAPEPPPVIQPVDISAFIKVPEIVQHPAAQYAIKRGWTYAQVNDILVDYFTSAVVFVIREKGEVVGYQRRFVKPADPKFKTMSSKGFLKRRFVVEYPNNGDICVCEGPFSALSAWAFGFHAICTFGSNVGELQLDKIESVAKETGKSVAIAFDLDAAGRKGYLRIRNTMFWRGVATYRVEPEVGNDLNDAWQAGKYIRVVPSNETDAVLDGLNLPFN